MKNFILLLLIFLVVLALYHPALFTFFAQDDFFHIKIAQTNGSFTGFIKLFGIYPFEERGIAFYRPVFREALYNIFYSLFSLNALPYRIFSFLILFADISLVYILVKKILSQKIALFTAFFFGITAANVATIYYFTGGIQSLGATFFMLLSLLFYWNFLQTKKPAGWTLSFLFFVLAITSHDLAVVTPTLLSGLIFLKAKNIKIAFIQSIKQLWMFSVLVFIYLYLNIYVIGFSQTETQYQVVLSIKTFINSLGWYLAWSLGLPEMLIDFVRPGLKLNPSLMRYWGDYFRIIFPAFFLSFGFLLASAAYLTIKKFDFFKDKRFWFFASWFPMTLLPVIFLPWHKSTYYLLPALPGFWAAVAFMATTTYQDIKLKKPKLASILMGSFVGVLFILSLVSIYLGRETYWAATRGRLAEKLIQDVSSKYQDLPNGAILYFENDPKYPFVADSWGGTSKQASFILNGSEALQLFYKDPTLQVYYEDDGNLPEDLSGEKIYSIIAIIN